MSANSREQNNDGAVNNFQNNEEDDLVAVRGGEAIAIDEDSDESGVESLENDDFEKPWGYEAIDGLDVEDSEASENEESVCVACCIYKAKATFSTCGHRCICLKCKYTMELSEARNLPDSPDKMYRCVKCGQRSPEIIRVLL